MKDRINGLATYWPAVGMIEDSDGRILAKMPCPEQEGTQAAMGQFIVDAINEKIERESTRAKEGGNKTKYDILNIRKFLG